MPELLTGSVVKRLLTLCGLVVAGWLLGGAGSAHAGVTGPDPDIASPAAASAPAGALRGAGETVRSALGGQAALRSGGPAVGTFPTPPARDGRIMTGGRADSPFLDPRGPGAPSCGSFGDLMATLCEARSELPLPTPRIWLPDGLQQAILGPVVPVGVAHGTGEGARGSGAWTLPVRAEKGAGHRRHVTAAGRDGAAVRAAARAGDDRLPSLPRTTTRPAPVHAPAMPESPAPRSTVPAAGMPLTGAGAAAFLSGFRLPAGVRRMVVPQTGVIAPRVHSATDEPSFSPD